nr:MAG TPA: IrrE protein [Caudoviricetes sp.]
MDVEKIAEEAGITINYAALPASSPHAYWNPAARTITVRYGLPYRYTRSFIAHELGHAHYGHKVSTPKNERQADSYAAQLLITEEAYRRAEEAYGTSIEKLAYELDVMPSIITAWRQNHETVKGKAP